MQLDDSPRRDDRDHTVGQEAGKAAYYVQKNAKKAATELGHELKSFGKDAHEGWKDAKQTDRERKAERERERQ